MRRMSSCLYRLTYRPSWIVKWSKQTDAVCLHISFLSFWCSICLSKTLWIVLSFFFCISFSSPHSSTDYLWLPRPKDSQQSIMFVDLLGLHWLRGLVTLLAVWHLNWLMTYQVPLPISQLMPDGETETNVSHWLQWERMRSFAYRLDPYRTQVLPLRHGKAGWRGTVSQVVLAC